MYLESIGTSDFTVFHNVPIGRSTDNANSILLIGRDGKATYADRSVKLKTVLKHKPPVRALAFRSDGRRLVAAGEDGKILLWNFTSDPSDNSSKMVKPESRQELVCPSAVMSVAYAPSGMQLVAGCNDGTVRYWKLGSSRPAAKKLQHPGGWQSIYAVAFSPDGRFIASGSITGKTYLWHTGNCEIQHVFQIESGSVRTVAFSPDIQTTSTPPRDFGI